MDTVRQYLDINDGAFTPFKNLNGGWTLNDGIYHIYDADTGMHQKAITLEKFKEMDIDIVISSIPDHDRTFAQLILDHKPSAKHIAQLGNIYQRTNIKNVMCSTGLEPEEGKNWVSYHQEFDLSIFRYEPPTNHNRVSSMVIGLPRRDLYGHYKGALPDYEFRAYGGAEDGWLSSLQDIAKVMRESSFGWQVKPGGDGYGFCLHHWFACGRPVITFFRDYAPYLGNALLEDGVTAINLDGKEPQQVIEEIRYFSDPERHKQMCENAYDRFKEVVCFERDGLRVQEFLERLI